MQETKNMTKKLLITLFIIALFASCGTRGDNNAQQPICPTTHDYGVLINGVRWATRNVDMPGTFAETPESFGMLFQWNRKKGWNAVDEEVEGWNRRLARGRRWTRVNDPCPKGWRVPTFEEILSLENADSEWTTKNGVYGRIFGSTLFLPAAGWRNSIGSLTRVGGVGFYWSSTQGRNTINAWYLSFNRNSVYVPGKLRDNGLSVRCVSIN